MNNDAIIKTLYEIISDISDSMCQNIRSNDDYTPESDLKKNRGFSISRNYIRKDG